MSKQSALNEVNGAAYADKALAVWPMVRPIELVGCGDDKRAIADPGTSLATRRNGGGAGQSIGFDEPQAILA